MWDIWANQLLLKALKTCPKSNKSPNLVPLTKTKSQWNATTKSHGKVKKK